MLPETKIAQRNKGTDIHFFADTIIGICLKKLYVRILSTAHTWADMKFVFASWFSYWIPIRTCIRGCRL